MAMMIDKSRIESFISIFVTVHPHETSALIYSTSSFFFILSAYFVVLPLRDEGAISLGLGNLPELFVGSLLLTLVAAPVSTLVFSMPNLSKGKGLFLILRFFSLSLVIFFILWHFSTPGNLPIKDKEVFQANTIKDELKVTADQTTPANSGGWESHGWFYIAVRIAMFLWVALLNLITISSTWARVIDVMDSESGSRLFGFIGAGATFGQLFGSLFATGMAWFGPYLLLVAALLLEFAAQSSVGINKDISQRPEELSPIRKAHTDHNSETDEKSEIAVKATSPRISTSTCKFPIWSILEGLLLILSSTYLLQVALFLWLSAVISSFFYFQKVTVIATAVTSPVGRRKMFAQINSFIAVFILGGQLTLTGRILTVAGVTAALCCAPFVAFVNLIALSIWPSWIAVAVSETLRKVVIYVVTRPGRELLFTVVTEDEKYKAKRSMRLDSKQNVTGMYRCNSSKAWRRHGSRDVQNSFHHYQRKCFHGLPLRIACVFSVDSNGIPFRSTSNTTSQVIPRIPSSIQVIFCGFFWKYFVGMSLSHVLMVHACLYYSFFSIP